MPDAPPPAPPSADTADGCAPGCCIFVMLVGIFLAVTAAWCLDRSFVPEPPPPAEFDPLLEAQNAAQPPAYNPWLRAGALGLASAAYMLLVWGALEYWHAVKPEPTAFGKRLSELGQGARVNSEGLAWLGHPLRYERYALAVAAGAGLYDLALAAAVWSGQAPLAAAIPCALFAALFNIHALIGMHAYAAAKVVRANLRTPIQAQPGGAIEVEYRVEVQRDASAALKVLLLGVDAYFPKARWWEKSVTQRLECVHRTEVLVEPAAALKAGDVREGRTTLRLPDSPPAPRGTLHWFAALVADIPGWPDFETVEPVELPAAPGLPDARSAPSPPASPDPPDPPDPAGD
ncbi:MAG: hypothetical protein HS116_10020 [Planctomycetes bacterium]|nr:hypothetical protein [Planctomycetota bacterium]